MEKISASLIKELRLATGARIIDCQKALQEANGDLDEAQKIVKAKGLARAEKNQDRDTAAGYIACYEHANGKVAAVVELLCETDFVAQNEEFKTLARQIAMQVAAMNPSSVADLLSQEYIKDPSQTIEVLVKSLSGKIGEKMVLNRFQRLELGN